MIQCAAFFFVMLLAGCGSAPDTDGAEAETLSTDIPASLGQAHLVYERDGGIVYAVPGRGDGEKIITHGACPRWSPAGDAVVFLRDSEVCLYVMSNKQTRVVYRADDREAAPASPDFHPVSGEIWFISGDQLKSVATRGGPATTRFAGEDFRELDLAPGGTFAAVTVKRLAGYQVERIDLASGSFKKMGRGCSASISGDNTWITVNQAGHTRLALHDSMSGSEKKILTAPPGVMLDNQKCSNHPDWLVGISEGRERFVIVQHLGNSGAWRLTGASGCDRPDLFVE